MLFCFSQIMYRELTFLKQIGEGSFGRVYMARWRETTVAVKVLLLALFLAPLAAFPAHGTAMLAGRTASLNPGQLVLLCCVLQGLWHHSPTPPAQSSSCRGASGCGAALATGACPYRRPLVGHLPIPQNPAKTLSKPRAAGAAPAERGPFGR